MNLPDFIALYPDLLSAERCRAIIEQFDANNQAVPGRVGGGLMPELKHSRDIQLNRFPDWQTVERELNTVMFKALLAYIRQYPFALIAPLFLQRKNAEGQIVRIQYDNIPSMNDKELGDVLRTVFRPGSINIQRYEAEQGGYPYWHCEHYPKEADAESLHRTLLWTLYLNEDFSEGETEFFYQQRKIKPQTGSLLIAPASFTHTHRGNAALHGAKYIATSWVLFQRADVLYRSR